MYQYLGNVDTNSNCLSGCVTDYFPNSPDYIPSVLVMWNRTSNPLSFLTPYGLNISMVLFEQM